MFASRTASIFALAMAALLGATASARAYCRLTTEKPRVSDTCAANGLGLSWRSPCLSFSVLERAHDEPPLEDVRNVIDRSFATWSNVTCEAGRVGIRARETSALAQCDEAEYNTHDPNANTVIFIDDWADRELPDDAFGLTLVWHNGMTGEIYDADIQLNETIGPFAICGLECPDGAVDLENVVTHEAGHFFGLGHSQVRTATMSSRATIGETIKRDLSTDDRAGLCAIYGDVREPVCVDEDFTPRHGFSPLCGPPDKMDQTGGGCHVALGGAGSSAFGALGAMLSVCALIARRRRRSD
jgi:hypothetical protein